MKTQIFLSILAAIVISAGAQASADTGASSSFCSKNILVDDIVGQYFSFNSSDPSDILFNVGGTGTFQDVLGLGAALPSADLTQGPAKTTFSTLTWTKKGHHTYTGVLAQLNGIASFLPGDSSLGVFPMTQFFRTVEKCRVSLSSNCKVVTVNVFESCTYQLNSDGSTSLPGTCSTGSPLSTLKFTKDLQNPNNTN